MDARTVTALDVIATFAAQILTPPCGVVGLWLLNKSPCQANHSAYFGWAKFYLSRTFSAVDGGKINSWIRVVNAPFQCKASVP